ncbi:MAG: 30S ribosomal protein S8 [Desulfobulbaceae bacterium DB1]|nr:MAG: 30S ribosomal protein S8 [Desulfobulbaceae bacterium DB1]
MAMSDTLADMLTRIRNARMVKFESLEMPHSKLNKAVAEILKKEGYIQDLQVMPDNKQGRLKISLKYDQHHTCVITGLKRVSKPGCRVYVKSDKIPKVMSGLGIAVLSTSRGILTDREARETGIGGELLFTVW